MNDDERCPGTNREGEPCGHPAGWGTDRDTGPCKFHGGAADNRGKNNGNYEHGAYSEYLTSDLSEQEQTALEGIVGAFDDPDGAQELIKHQAAEAYLKYKRAGDERFLREYRQLVDTFNLAPNADKIEADVDSNGGLDEATEVALREALRARRGEN
jgi:hypothetical protein